MSQAERSPALLLLGPTGAGKSPLGQVLETRGFQGARCVHFDFGANLRRLAEADTRSLLSRADLDVLHEVLRTGALLEDRQFPIAERIVRSFLARSGADRRTVVALNGLPRHVGQAAGVDRILEIRLLVNLDCSGQTVLERIRSDIGGDRAGRMDDDGESVRKKLALFAARTAPLLDHYRGLGVRIETVEVTPRTTAEEVWEQLDHRGE